VRRRKEPRKDWSLRSDIPPPKVGNKRNEKSTSGDEFSVEDRTKEKERKNILDRKFGIEEEREANSFFGSTLP